MFTPQDGLVNFNFFLNMAFLEPNMFILKSSLYNTYKQINYLHQVAHTVTISLGIISDLCIHSEHELSSLYF